VAQNEHKSTTTLEKVFVIVFIAEHALLLAVSIALFTWLVAVVVPHVHMASLMNDGPGPAGRNSERAHPIEGLMIALAWMGPISYSIVVPWKRRRLDEISIAGAVLIAIELFALGLADHRLFAPLTIYTGFVVSPAIALACENRAIRKAGPRTDHRPVNR
jgi:hypothetical protein